MCIHQLDEISMFFFFLVDTDKYDEALSTFRELENHQIGHLCKVVPLEKVPDIASYIPKICGFEVNDEVMTIIPELDR